MSDDLVYGAIETPTSENIIAEYLTFFMHDWNDSDSDVSHTVYWF
jgi:hypothetical protein